MGKLNILVPKARYDNDLFTDIAIVHNEALLGTDRGVSIYRARKEGQPVAAVVASTAPDGYNGEIRLLVGINYDGTLIGVRVVGHKETPGLGDMIDARRSNWILSFDGLSLNNLTRTSWNVKRDGGVFDQFTGATITPRAVVKAVHNTLLHFEQNRDDIFSIATASTIAE
jgi:electron transport complex protein RnfG